ncbi:MAG: VTT domain-containing protein [Chthoniobacteraceae bacterium]
MLRLFWIALTLAVLVLLIFALCGARFETWFSGAAAVGWIRSWGPWGWLAVILLLVSDLFLPVPATPIMSAAGFVYGTAMGGMLSALGSFLAGVAAYELCACLGRRAAERIAAPEELERGHQLFVRRGPWLVALSRALPILPEVISCMAGLTKMPRGLFLAALACGSVPMGFIYAAIGAAGQSRPSLALALSGLCPVLLWLLARRLFTHRRSGDGSSAALENRPQ